MEFHNLKTLFGAALTSGEPIIANNPCHDPRRGGLPEGQPALNAFLGIPVHHGKEMVALVGISNRPAGYDRALIEFLRPLLATLGQLVVAARIQQQHHKDQKELNQFKRTLGRTLDCVFMFDAAALRFFYVNEGALWQVGYSRDELLSMHPYDITPDVSETQFHALIAPLLAGEKDALTFETAHQNKNGQRVRRKSFCSASHRRMKHPALWPSCVTSPSAAQTGRAHEERIRFRREPRATHPADFHFGCVGPDCRWRARSVSCASAGDDQHCTQEQPAAELSHQRPARHGKAHVRIQGRRRIVLLPEFAHVAMRSDFQSGSRRLGSSW